MSLSFAFSEEQNAFRERVAAFAEREIRPKSVYYDRKGDEYPWDWNKAMADEGLIGLTYPKELGGQGESYIMLGIAVEELGKVDLVASTLCNYLNVYGKTPGIPETVVRSIIKGDTIISFAESEAKAGADAANISMTAIRSGDNYVLNGTKLYASLMPAAQYMLVTAKTAPELGRRGISLFLVPSDLPGIKASHIHIPGRKAHLLGKVVFQDVQLPASSRLGEENGAFRVMRGLWDYSRCNVGLMAIGAASRALDDVASYAKKRKTFGSPLAKWESIQFRIVDNHIALEAARWMAYRALWMHDQGMRATKEGSAVKILATTAALKAIVDAHMIHGASGLNIEQPYEKVHRDIMSLYITGGGVDVHKIVVGSALLGPEFVPYK